MRKDLEIRCNEVTKELLGSLKNLKKEKQENEKPNEKNSDISTSLILNSNNG